MHLLFYFSVTIKHSHRNTLFMQAFLLLQRKLRIGGEREGYSVTNVKQHCLCTPITHSCSQTPTYQELYFHSDKYKKDPSTRQDPYKYCIHRFIYFFSFRWIFYSGFQRVCLGCIWAGCSVSSLTCQ